MEILASNGQRKVLPVKYPIITSYQPYANFLSVLQNDDGSFNWIYNNYIQICTADLSKIRRNSCNPIIIRYYSYDNCPYIDYHRLDRNYLTEKWDNINDFIIYCINSGYYLTFYLDQYYIPCETRAYHILHNMHDIFIYGYDLDTKMYYTADFYNGRKYSYAMCSFADIELAYKNFVQSEQYWQFDDVIIFKNKKHVQYDIDLAKISEFINDYVQSVNTVERLNLPELPAYSVMKHFGANIYYTLEEYMNNKLNNPDYFDLRCFYVVWDQKSLMLSRIKYLEDNHYIKNDKKISYLYSQIENQFHIYSTMIVKYNISKDNRIIERLLKSVKASFDNETNILKLLLESLNR